MKFKLRNIIRLSDNIYKNNPKNDEYAKIFPNKIRFISIRYLIFSIIILLVLASSELSNSIKSQSPYFYFKDVFKINSV